ncbi:MAG: hypothetical protein HQ522_21470 [Bacteroidetes bacterium]|nr:hypothetical protein [Bacteroidota bacterium]
MTTNQQIKKERLQTSIDKCLIHRTRLNYATSQSEDLFPLTVDRYNSISEASIGNIDQMVFRFTKLQDELGNNTFRFLLEFLLEDITGKPFRDILNILERLQIIDSSDIWLSLRELRNDLTREYPMMIDETINKLNHLYLQLPLLEKILQTVQQVASS